MRDFVIITDSCCDLSAELAKELNVEAAPLTVSMEGGEYRNYLDGREIGFHEFYEKVRRGAMGTTSAVSVGAFAELMRPILSAGKDILCLNFSSALSTTYQSAVIAAEDLRTEFPGSKIYVVDSLSASLGQGLLVWLCAREKAAGKSIEEVRDYAEAMKGRIRGWFTVDDLNHLKRGGRISATTAMFGTMLSIKPVMRIDETGHLVAASKARGRKAALLALVDEMEKGAQDPANQTVFISHGDCLADAQFVAEEIRRRCGTKDFIIHFVGPVIGSHTGCGVVALFFVGKE
ncbi:MAG: DegV family protein [Oscillibacter sp.]|nr:DegV family protein [Oscillibacter sp.]